MSQTDIVQAVLHPKFQYNDDNPRDKLLTDYIRGKRVALIGPGKALEGSGLGPTIDKFDVVVRINGGFKLMTANPGDFGSRTDVQVYNQKFRLTWSTENLGGIPDEYLFPGLKFVQVMFQKRLDCEKNTVDKCAFCNKPFKPGELVETVLLECVDPVRFFGLGTKSHTRCFSGKMWDEIQAGLYDFDGKVVIPTIAQRFWKTIWMLLPNAPIYNPEDSFMDILAGFHVILDLLHREPKEVWVAGMDFYEGAKQCKPDKDGLFKVTDYYAKGYEVAKDSCLRGGHKDEGDHCKGMLKKLYLALNAEARVGLLTLHPSLYDLLFGKERTQQDNKKKLKKILELRQNKRGTKRF